MTVPVLPGSAIEEPSEQWEPDGLVDFRVEVATIPIGGSGTIWDIDNWDEGEWSSNVPAWVDTTAQVLGLSTNLGAERWSTRVRDGSAMVELDNDSGIFNPDAGAETEENQVRLIRSELGLFRSFRSTVEAELTGILSDYQADARLQDGFEASISGRHGLNTDQGWLFNIAASVADETFAYRFQNDRLRFTVRTADDTFTIQSTQVFADGDEFVAVAEYDPVVGEIRLRVNGVVETPVPVTGLLNLAAAVTFLSAFQRSRFPSADRAFLGDIFEATLVADGVLIAKFDPRDTGFGSGAITPGSDWEDDAGVEWVVGENLTMIIEPSNLPDTFLQSDLFGSLDLADGFILTTQGRVDTPVGSPVGRIVSLFAQDETDRVFNLDRPPGGFIRFNIETDEGLFDLDHSIILNEGDVFNALAEYKPAAPLVVGFLGGGPAETVAKASLDVTGDLEAIAAVRINAAGVQTILGKWEAAGGEKSYRFGVTAGGELTFEVSDDGTATDTAVSTEVIPIFGIDMWVRVLFSQLTGNVSFYLSGDPIEEAHEFISWGQLGDTVTISNEQINVGSLALRAGSDSDGAAPFNGRLYGVWLDGDDGEDPPANVPVFEDDWIGSDGDPWDVTKWVTVTINADVDIQNDRGRTLSPGPGGPGERLAVEAIMTPIVDQEMLIDVQAGLNYNNNSYPWWNVRGSGVFSSDAGFPTAYRLDMQPGSANILQLQSRVSGSLTLLDSISHPMLTDFEAYTIRFSAIGDQIKVKIWLTADAEPIAWDMEVTDSAVTAAGVVAVGSIAFSNTNKLFFYDNLSVFGASAAPFQDLTERAGPDWRTDSQGWSVPPGNDFLGNDWAFIGGGAWTPSAGGAGSIELTVNGTLETLPITGVINIASTAPLTVFNRSDLSVAQGFIGAIRGMLLVNNDRRIIAQVLVRDIGIEPGLEIPEGHEWDDPQGNTWTAGVLTFIEEVSVPGGRLALRPGRWLRIAANAQHGWSDLFTGTIDGMEEVYSEGADHISMLLQCTGFGALFSVESQPALQNAVGAGERTDQRVDRVLDLIGWFSGARLIDQGDHTMVSTTLARTRTEEMMRASDAEGGIFYFDGEGFAVFRSRDFLLTDPRSVNVQFQPGSNIPGDPQVIGIVSQWEAGRVNNDVQLARTGGEALRVQNTQSQALYGRRAYQRFDYEVENDVQVQDLADQLLERRQYDRLSVDQATLNAPDIEAARTIFEARLGDRIRIHVVTLRGWGYAVDTWIVGVQYQVSASDWNVTYRLADTATGLPPGVGGAYDHDAYSDGYVIGTEIV